MKLFNRLIGLFALVPLTACAITTMGNGQGEIETRYTFIAPVNKVEFSTEGGYAEMEGIGLASTNGQVALGVFDVRALNISPDCRLVIISASAEEIEAMRRLLGSEATLCGPVHQQGGEQ